jgi:hypothetical protein
MHGIRGPVCIYYKSKKRHQSRRERKGGTQREDPKHQSIRERKGGPQREDPKHQSIRERKGRTTKRGD